MATTEISKPDTHLKIYGDYQNFLIHTWKSDSARPWKVYRYLQDVFGYHCGGAPFDMMCDKCLYVQVEFKRGIRDENGVRIPYEVRTGLPHNCDCTYSYNCRTCGKLIYLDKKVLSRENNKRIPLNFGSDDFHFYNWRTD